jgi:3-oxoadipate enol-lactonase
VPFVTADGARINYQLDGPEGRPVLVLSNSLGTDFSMWEPQVAPFTRHFRLLRYDQRGHGKSDAPAGPYTMERLGRDVLALLDGLGLKKARFCGLSMGGMTGMWLGANAGERFEKLALCNTSGDTTHPELWDQRMEMVREQGMKAIAAASPERWFTKEFRERAPATVARICALVEATPAEGYLGCCGAIRNNHQHDSLGRIVAPTLVIAGASDPATPPAAGRAVAERIKGAKYVELPAAHLSNIEQPERFTAEVLGFLRG